MYYCKRNKEKRNHLSCKKLPQHYSKTKHISFMIIGLVLNNLYFGEIIKRLNTNRKKIFLRSIILPQGPSNGMYQSQLSLLLIEPSHVQLQNRQPWLPAKINNINLQPFYLDQENEIPKFSTWFCIYYAQIIYNV